MKILDEGCSAGEFIAIIGWNKLGRYKIEVSDNAEKNFNKRGIKFDEVQSKNFFDIVLFREKIQYVNNTFMMLGQVDESLKPGRGVFFLLP